MTERIVPGCSGKWRFLTYGKADSAAKAMRRKKDAHVEAYHCKHCAGFHVGEPRDYGKADKRQLHEAET